MTTLDQFKDKVYRKGVQRGLNLAAAFLEQTAEDFAQMAGQCHKDKNIPASDRLSDKADLLRGQAQLVRTLQFRDVRPPDDRRKELNEKAGPAKGTA